MNISILDLESNTTLEQNAMNDLLGGFGCYFPQRCCAPIYCAPVYCAPIYRCAPRWCAPVRHCGWGFRKNVRRIVRRRRNNR